jgi:hypothetical protein
MRQDISTSCLRVAKVASTCLGLVLAGACGDSPAAPVDTIPPGTLHPIPILGLGSVSERFTAEVAVREPWAYTTTWGLRGTVRGNAIKVWNVSGLVPVLVDSVIVDFATQVGDVQISDDGSLLMVATERNGGSIVLFDLTDPASPQQLSRHSTANTSVGVHTAKFGRVDGVLYAFLSVNQSVTPSQLVIVDLSNPAAPTEVLVRQMGTPFIHDVFVRDEILFTALWNGGLTIWDLGGLAAGGSAADPVQVGNVLTVNGSVHNAWWFHDPHSGSKRYVFVGEEGPGTVGSSSSGDIHVVDVSDMTSPREVAFFRALPDSRGRPVGTHNFHVDEDNGVLYAAFYNGGVRAFDIRGDLSTCSAGQRAPDQRCDLAKMGRELGAALTSAGDVYTWGVQQEGANLYASDMLNGLWKLDVSALRGR